MWRFLLFVVLALWTCKLPGVQFAIEVAIYLVERQRLPVLSRLVQVYNELESLKARQLKFGRLCLYCVRNELLDQVALEIAACRSAIARQYLERKALGSEWTAEQTAELEADRADLVYFNDQLDQLDQMSPISAFDFYRQRLDERVLRKSRHFERLWALHKQTQFAESAPDSHSGFASVKCTGCRVPIFIAAEFAQSIPAEFAVEG